MFDVLKIGDRIRLTDGYEMNPKWLSGQDCYSGTIATFIPGQNQNLAVVRKLEQTITFDNIIGDILILELRYVGATWTNTGTVHVELCNFMPEPVAWKYRKQGKWVESHATYTKM